jgi:hypothetical protein
VTLSLFGIFIFTSPFLRVLAVLISIFCEKEGRKKVKVKDNWTTEGTVRFEYDGGVTVQRIAQEKHDVHCELLVAIPVITQSLRKSRQDLDTDIRHPKSFCCAFKTSPLYV